MTGGVRRPRNIRSRIAAAQRARQAPTQQETAVEEEGGELESNSSEEEDEGLKAFSGKKVGTKKLRRLQEKAEKKAMREVGYLSVLLDCTVIKYRFLVCACVARRSDERRPKEKGGFERGRETERTRRGEDS